LNDSYPGALMLYILFHPILILCNDSIIVKMKKNEHWPNEHRPLDVNDRYQSVFDDLLCRSCHNSEAVLTEDRYGNNAEIDIKNAADGVKFPFKPRIIVLTFY